jgi:hypothetical protein
MLKCGGFFFLPHFGEEVQRETPEITRPCASLTGLRHDDQPRRSIDRRSTPRFRAKRQRHHDCDILVDWPTHLLNSNNEEKFVLSMARNF